MVTVMPHVLQAAVAEILWGTGELGPSLQCRLNWPIVCSRHAAVLFASHRSFLNSALCFISVLQL